MEWSGAYLTKLLYFTLTPISGYNCWRWTYTWGYACTHHIWQWQNNSFCHNWVSRVSPSLPVTWDHHKYCLTCWWEWSPSGCIPSYPEKFIIMLFDFYLFLTCYIIAANKHQWKRPEYQCFVCQMYLCLTRIFAPLPVLNSPPGIPSGIRRTARFPLQSG